MSIIVIFKKFLRNFKFSEILDKNLSYLYRAQNIYTAVAPATAAFHYARNNLKKPTARANGTKLRKRFGIVSYTFLQKRWQKTKFKEDNLISYLVCHMDKYQRNAIVGVERENERDENYKSAKNPQIDNNRTSENYHVIKTESTYIKRINARIKELAPKRKIKDDAVLMCSFILGSDKEFFDSLTTQQMHEFFHDVTAFFENRYGTENILSAVVHLDETTPHMHLNLIPVFEDRLCAKRLFNRVELQNLQSDFHENVGKKWGLKRGKIGSTAKHLETTEFKAKKIIEGAQQQAEETKKQARQQAEDYLQGIHSSVEAESTRPVPKKRKQTEEEIKTLRTKNAAYKEHLRIKNEDSSNLFNLLQEAQRKNIGNDAAFKMITDMITAYPDEFNALLKKSREKKNDNTPTSHSSKNQWTK